MLRRAATCPRQQQTLAEPVQTQGVGFLTGADVTIRFLPAAPYHGIQFQRVDVPGSEPIPAHIDYEVPRDRRTAIANRDVIVELTEHVLAALAGLQIDNCLVQLDAVETPGCDGSSLAFVEALLSTEIVPQTEPRLCFVVEHPTDVQGKNGTTITALPSKRGSLTIDYVLDYGADSAIPYQEFSLEITPESFVHELAFARTFILESEITALKAAGYGRRTSEKDLLIFGSDGIIGNALRAPNECARHKILDCLGDFSLIGCDLIGHIRAVRSGHQLNRELVKELKRTHPNEFSRSEFDAA
jgi:UDP-3-O-[3-hydroxymyristoyl] N-acetylglucosamine deacetylase